MPDVADRPSGRNLARLCIGDLATKFSTVCAPDDDAKKAVETSADLVPTSSRSHAPQTLTPQGVQSPLACARARCVNSSPLSDPPRTALEHGLSAEELQRISGGMHALKRTGHGILYAVLGDAVLDLPEAQAREVIRAFTSRIVRDQARAGLRPFWLRVMESGGGLHANILFVATPEMKRSLASSEAFKPYLKRKKAIQWVDDFAGLASYLSKERPPVVKGGSRLGSRSKGSHKLGKAGGDRVTLSRELRDHAIEAGLITPWKRTKAKALNHHD